MSEPRIIKKYPNRRLYDTEVSSYITLEDVRKLVVDKVAIKVIDARSQEDITHSTLLQIILEQEEKGPSLFSTDSLLELIRFYNGSMQTMVGKLFEQGMSFFLEQQRAYAKSSPLTGGSWESEKSAQSASDFARENLNHWQKLQQQWLAAFQGTSPHSKENEESKPREENIS
jgi:polyhydroxyalkanoate synthesis repressor PhaR